MVLKSLRKNKVGLKGPLTTPIGTGFRSVNVAMRKIFDLYACVRPCKSYKGVRSKYENIDIVIIRENTEDLYAGIEFEQGKKETKCLINFIAGINETPIKKDSGISIKPISISGSERIIRFAFEYARNNNRKKVTGVHKANIMKYTDGLFLDVFRRVAADYPDIASEDRIVDNMCMQLVQKPELYDVLVLPNLYGDIISDLAAGLIGGLGVAPEEISESISHCLNRLMEARQNKGVKQGKPSSADAFSCYDAKDIGENSCADIMEKAIARVIAEGKSVTYDMKPTPDDPTAVGTSQMADMANNFNPDVRIPSYDVIAV